MNVTWRQACCQCGQQVFVAIFKGHIIVTEIAETTTLLSLNKSNMVKLATKLQAAEKAQSTADNKTLSLTMDYIVEYSCYMVLNFPKNEPSEADKKQHNPTVLPKSISFITRQRISQCGNQPKQRALVKKVMKEKGEQFKPSDVRSAMTETFGKETKNKKGKPVINKNTGKPKKELSFRQLAKNFKQAKRVTETKTRQEKIENSDVSFQKVYAIISKIAELSIEDILKLDHTVSEFEATNDETLLVVPLSYREAWHESMMDLTVNMIAADK